MFDWGRASQPPLDHDPGVNVDPPREGSDPVPPEAERTRGLTPKGTTAAPAGWWARWAAGVLELIDDPLLRADLREAFEERSAIAEYDGGLSRDEAERVAFLEIERAIQNRP